MKLYDYQFIESSCPELTQGGGLDIALRSVKVCVLRNLHVEEHIRHRKNICARCEIFTEQLTKIEVFWDIYAVSIGKLLTDVSENFTASAFKVYAVLDCMNLKI